LSQKADDILTNGAKVLEELRNVIHILSSRSRQVEVWSVISKCEKLIKRIIRELRLCEEDIKIFEIIWEELSRYRELRFWEAVDIVAGQIKKDKDYVVDKLLNLVRRKILDVYLK